MSRPRTYTSELRDAAARATRARILDRAEELFERDGYHRTTIAALARAAGVSPQTVYNSIGSKAAVLKALYDVRLAGDDEPIPMVERPMFKRMVAQRTMPATLRAYAAIGTELYRRAGGLVGMVVAEGAGRDEELAQFLDTIEGERRAGNRGIVGHVQATFGLRPELEPEVAVDIVWTLTSFEVADRLMRRCHWPAERYERWLGDALITGIRGR